MPDFTLEDVWALPVQGGAEDFQTLLELMVASDPAGAGSLPARILWNVRDRLGSLFGLGRYQAQMAVYVKPRGPLGKGYMTLIRPFRHWVVYPAIMRQVERTWNTRVPR